MSGRDLHKKPFDEGTIAKLEIFEDYAEAWIPTFVMANVPRIAIFDFFAGQGYDTGGVAGSAIRILQTINGQIMNIQSRGIRVTLYLNEFKKGKFDLLKEACENYFREHPAVKHSVEVQYSCDDFDVVFQRLIDQIGGVPSLVYLDQNGIKAISRRYFQELERKKQTDFLYFVSSSFFWRFGESEEFKAHLDFDVSLAKKDPYRFVHRHVLSQIYRGLPPGTKLMLYPFSIKKGANIHGLIFGATHPSAVEKFLRIAWKRNETNGEANFDIDDDDLKAQQDLWGGKRLTKLENFKMIVREKVLAGDLSNNKDLLQFCYSSGHLGSHADGVLREMKKQGDVWYEGVSPLVTYVNVFKNAKIIGYTVLRK